MITVIPLLFAITLGADVKQIAQRVDANIGVAAMDLDSGETFVLRGDDRFPLASVFKFPLAVEVLRRVDSGPLRLEQTYVIEPADFAPGHSPIRDRAKGKAVSLTLRELLTAAVSDSDNTAGDYLLRMVSPAAVTERMRALGAGEFRINRPEKEIIDSFDQPHGVSEYNQAHLDSATPRAALALLRAVYSHADGLSPASHALLEDMLTKSTNPARIGKLLPAGCTIAHKTGTMPGVLNDIGIVTSADGKHHFAIAIFTKNGTKSAEAEREEVVAQIARVLYDEWVR
jgi:beta-lactamase class A